MVKITVPPSLGVRGLDIDPQITSSSKIESTSPITLEPQRCLSDFPLGLEKLVQPIVKKKKTRKKKERGNVIFQYT